MNSNYNWKALAAVSALGFGMAIFIGLYPKTAVTPEDALLQASGKLAWVQEHRYGTRFGLVGVDAQFNYPSKARGMGIVREALQQAGEQPIAVRYERDTHGPVYSDERYHDVWVLSVGGRTVRSFGETEQARADDDSLMPWLSTAMAACGLLLGFAAWRVRQARLR